MTVAIGEIKVPERTKDKWKPLDYAVEELCISLVVTSKTPLSEDWFRRRMVELAEEHYVKYKKVAKKLRRMLGDYDESVLEVCKSPALTLARSR